MKILIPLLVLACTPWVQAGEMFKWTDKNGTVHFSDKKPAGSNASTVKSATRSNYFSSKIDIAEKSKTPENTLIMYSASWCGHCKKARAFLNDNDIDFIEKDIDHSADALLEYQAHGGQGTPLFLYNDKTLTGFTAHIFMRYYVPLTEATRLGLRDSN